MIRRRRLWRQIDRRGKTHQFLYIFPARIKVWVKAQMFLVSGELKHEMQQVCNRAAILRCIAKFMDRLYKLRDTFDNSWTHAAHSGGRHSFQVREKRDLLRLGSGKESLNTFCTNSTFRYIENTQHTRRVCRVFSHDQVREQVLDFCTVKESQATKDSVRNAVALKRRFQWSTLCIES